MVEKSLVDEAAELNAQANNLKKEVDKLKADIKAGLNNKEGIAEGKKFNAILKSKVQSRKLNQAKALEVVNRLGAKWLLTTVVDEEKLEDAIATGEIDGKEFADCVDTKTVMMITFKAKEKN